MVAATGVVGNDDAEILSQGRSLDRHTDSAPPERRISVPPRAWVDDMRTPAPEVVLAEFHRQKSLLAAAGALLQVEGRHEAKTEGGGTRSSKENIDANGTTEPATAEAGGATSRIPKLLRGVCVWGC